MRLTPEEIGEQLKAIRRSRDLSQSAFIKKYGARLGVADNTTLSRIENAERSPRRSTLYAYIEQFPEQSKAIKTHLESERPFVEYDRRTIVITQLADKTYEVAEEAESVIHVDRYVYAYCEGRDAANELRKRVPSLFGLTIMPLGGDLAARVDEFQFSEPLRYTEINGPGLLPRTHTFRPRLLSNEEILDISIDLSEDTLGHTVFWGCGLPTSGAKRFVTATTESRRSTLRDYLWRALNQHGRIQHKIRFRPLSTDMLGAFNVYAFFPESEVLRDVSGRGEVTCTVTVDGPSHPGNGWIVSWMNT